MAKEDYSDKVQELMNNPKNNNFHKAGIFAIVSSFLPPLDIIMIIGGILCLVSKESKK